MKKILASALLAATLITSAFATSVSAAETGTSYGKVPTVKTAITVDGKMDEIYSKGLAIDVDITTDSCPSTAKAYLLWNGTDTFYIYADIKDATPMDVKPANAWTCDSLEIFFDYSNKVARTRDQYRIDIQGTATYYDTKTYTNDECKAFGFEKWATAKSDTGYGLEFQIKAYKEAIKADMKIGFHAMLNDLLADGKTRKMANSDACGNTPAKFGYITLSSEVVEIVKKPAASADTFDPATIAVVASALSAAGLVVLKKRK